MTNGEVMINTIESVMGVEFDKSFGWKELEHDVVIAFDGSWWRKERTMTREEAITKLHWLKAELIKGTDLNEPLDMAIEALKEQPTIPMFTESEEAYKAWTGEEIGGDVE